MTQQKINWAGNLAFPGGTSSKNDLYLGPERTLSVNTDKYSLRMHDGVTVGGIELNSGVSATDLVQWNTSPLVNFGSYSENQTISLSVQARSAYGLPVIHTVLEGSLPPGITLNTNTGSLTGKLPELTGNTDYTFTIKATDTINTVVRTFTISVTATNSPPTWVTASALGTITEPFNIQLSATDIENKPLTYSLISGSLPSGVTLSSSGLISGPNPYNGSTYSFTASVSDGVNSTSRSFTLTAGVIHGSAAWGVPGTYYLTVPNGVTSMLLTGVGGGGGGGGVGASPRSNSGDISAAGGGGGSGAYTHQYIPVTPGETLTVVVGAGGGGGYNGNGGGGGYTQVLGSISNTVLQGGSGGFGGYVGTGIASYDTNADGSTSTKYYPPSYDANHILGFNIRTWYSISGKGNVAGNSNGGAGTNGRSITGHYANCPGGGGGGNPIGNGGAAGTTGYKAGDRPGNPGSGYGAGGGGATGYNHDKGSGRPGGNGTSGYVRLEW